MSGAVGGVSGGGAAVAGSIGGGGSGAVSPVSAGAGLGDGISGAPSASEGVNGVPGDSDKGPGSNGSNITININNTNISTQDMVSMQSVHQSNSCLRVGEALGAYQWKVKTLLTLILKPINLSSV